jgi:hypothetical protein
MESEDPSGSGVFFTCLEDESTGFPVRLVGEDVLFVLPPCEELRLDVFLPNSWKPVKLSGWRCRLTTHRLCWHTANEVWLALRLDSALAVEAGGGGGWLLSTRLMVTLASKASLKLRVRDAAAADQLLDGLRAALRDAKWRDSSFEVAAMGGLQRVLKLHESRQRARREELDVALSDLESLRQHASKAVAAARQAAALAEDGNRSSVQRLLHDFGLLGPDSKSVATGGALPEEVKADVSRVCVAALEKRGGLGLLLVHDVYCLVNRARGVALLSPQVVMEAVMQAAAPGGVLRLRKLGAAKALAVSLARTSDADADAELLSAVEGGLRSTTDLASEFGLTTSEAKYLCSDAELRGVLVRDDAAEGVFFYRNFFDDY